MKKVLLFILLNTVLAFSQQVYKIPFASKDNSIELSVVNKSTEEVKNIQVNAIDLPNWIKLDPANGTGETNKIIPSIKPEEEVPVLFTFSIEKEAMVNKETTLNFNVTSKSGEVWKKEITISVLPRKV